MPIQRVEEVVYGVENLAKAASFCADFGLAPVSDAPDRAVFRTAENQRLVLRPIDAVDLPPAVSPEQGIRQIVWGVRAPTDLQVIAERLGGSRPVRVDADGAVHSVDETGFAIAFRVSAKEDAVMPRMKLNTYGQTERREARTAYGRAVPRRLIHVALDIPKENHLQARQLYIDLLGFKPTEDIAPTGVFLQCEDEEDHHQLFLCHRTDKPGTNHCAFETRDIDEVIEGGNFLVDKGWKEVRRMGRHTVGSNLYRFFTTPMGGRFEYATDMDKVSKDTPTVHWEGSPPHHMWMLRTNVDLGNER